MLYNILLWYALIGACFAAGITEFHYQVMMKESDQYYLTAKQMGWLGMKVFLVWPIFGVAVVCFMFMWWRGYTLDDIDVDMDDD